MAGRRTERDRLSVLKSSELSTHMLGGATHFSCLCLLQQSAEVIYATPWSVESISKEEIMADMLSRIV
jgi:hypothetical protein